ncbi:MAG: ribonuclease HII [Clostridiales bacterium]|nr:ribonuclease HII [Clostridiales bacterium]
MKAIGEIKQMLASVPVQQLPTALLPYQEDTRVGVKKLVEAFEKKYQCYIKELSRLESISNFEKECFEKGLQLVCGVDEVGRGPLAGPVVAGAVILKQDCRILGINDSKKLSKVKREELYETISREAISWSIGVISPQRIDEINILQATYEAMTAAIDGLCVKPEQILVDAVTIPQITIPQRGIVKGDEKSISIGAASIMAKVSRDRMMLEYDALYPGYHFAQNKGYGSSEHIQAIKSLGITPIHRKSFVKNFL